MKTFYHVTLQDNYESIKRDGLIPKIGVLSDMVDEQIERIYLFPTLDDMENALYNWLGMELEEEFGEDAGFCSLKITVPDDFPIENGEVEYETYSYVKIPPEYIEYLKEE